MNKTDQKARDSKRLTARKAREERNVFSRLPAVYAASRRQGEKFLSRGGNLSIVEWRTLWDLHDAGPMTIRELSELQRSDQSLLSRALPSMRAKGYVSMQRCEVDGRQTVVALAPAGEEAYLRAAPIMAKRRQAMRAIFSEDELDTFIGYLDRFEVFLRQPIDDILDPKETP